jgi:bis(5'-nucleosyl)-tetraphosphatase (symmetrical)
MEAVWRASDAPELFDWLRRQAMLWHSPDHDAWVVHAGLPPCWSWTDSQQLARELERTLQSEPEQLATFFTAMWGDQPSCWDSTLTGHDRLRFAVNAFTRMRMMPNSKCLDLTFKGPPGEAPDGLKPWFSWWPPLPADTRLFFGHWAALQGHTGRADIVALDTGCVWGGTLTAIRLEDSKTIQVDAGLS